MVVSPILMHARVGWTLSMRGTIAWHERYDVLGCSARLAAELGYLIRAWEGSDCYGSYSTDIFA